MRNLPYLILVLITGSLLILKFTVIFISWWIISPFLLITCLLTYLSVNYYIRTKVREYKVLWEVKNLKVQVEHYLNNFKFPPEFRVGLMEMQKRYEKYK